MKEKDVFQAVRPTAKECRKCQNSISDSVFENGPEKAYCKAFKREKGQIKPKAVLFKGASCPRFKAIKG